MAAELEPFKLNADSHLLLEQPLLRLPHELVRRNFNTARRYCEREKDQILPALKDTANASLKPSTPPEQTLASLDAMITRMQNLKRKLEVCHEEELSLYQQSERRIQHLQDLYQIESLTDVKYDQWSRMRLDRLLVDYLLRSGYLKTAESLAKEKGIDELVDLKPFMQCFKIARSLLTGQTKEALTWCDQNKLALKKLGQNNLEFELRLQQYIVLVRTRNPAKLLEARKHAHKYFMPHLESQDTEIKKAAGLLAQEPDTDVEPYRQMYSDDRWKHLFELFISTHFNFFNLPPTPLLHIALSAGLSALKTPSCHSAFQSSSGNANSSAINICPICSTELNELAKNVPYAHHNKSHVPGDAVVLPNGRVYGRERLSQMQRMLYGGMAGVEEGMIRDPTTKEIFSSDDLKKVFFM
ncbi:MAG: hypothetical protein Q9227_007541 [Pyrenula ochraceoflavens]